MTHKDAEDLIYRLMNAQLDVDFQTNKPGFLEAKRDFNKIRLSIIRALSSDESKNKQ